MADKQIRELGERTVFDDNCQVPLDDGTQTFKIPGSKMFDFFNESQFTGVTRNVGLSATAASSALTIALKVIGASADATNVSRTDSIDAWFRSTTLTSGARTKVSFTAALSIVIPSTATMGYANGADNKIYVYLYYDGTNKGLCVSSKLYNTRILYSLSAIGTAADDNGLYADAARTNAALILIGAVQVDAMTTAGTWTAPTSVYISERQQSNSSYLMEVFTASGTYTKKPNVSYIIVTVIGAGGGGGGCATSGGSEGGAAGGGGGAGTSIKVIQNTSVGATETVTVGAGGTAASAGNNSGGTGGTSSFGAHCSATGGGGGGGSSATTTVATGTGGAAGIGSGGNVNTSGADGGYGRVISGNAIPTGNGGASSMGGGASSSGGAEAGLVYGGGASGATVPASTSARAGAVGAAGIIIVEEFYL